MQHKKLVQLSQEYKLNLNGIGTSLDKVKEKVANCLAYFGEDDKVDAPCEFFKTFFDFLNALTQEQEKKLKTLKRNKESELQELSIKKRQVHLNDCLTA